jgi:hypothetical protein
MHIRVRGKILKRKHAGRLLHSWKMTAYFSQKVLSGISEFLYHVKFVENNIATFPDS